MKNARLVLILLVIFSSIVLANCNSQKGIGGTSKKCGCGISKGMSGY
jgi:predicted small secreted protein